MSELMFTYASLERNTSGHHDPGALVFSHPTEADTEALLLEITEDPTFRKIFNGAAGSIWPEDESTLVASPDLSSDVFATMESADENDVVTLFSPLGHTERVNLYEAYYGCTLPHKLILGCEDCYRSGPNPKDCRLKQIAFTGTEGANPGPCLGDLRDTLVSKKTTIGEFRYVSPRLTATDPFSRTFRTIDRHDFSAVEHNARLASQSAKERERRRKFRKQVCTTCLVYDHCVGARPEGERNRCCGAYTVAKPEAVERMLAQITIPYSNEELAQCLGACGGLKKRFRGCKTFATFTMQGQILTFGFRRLHRPSQFVPLLPGQELQDHLERYCYQYGSVPLSSEEKAILCELAHMDYSPTMGNGWHKTRYPAIYMDRTHKKAPQLQLHYRYNSGRRGLLPWTLVASSIGDIFANQGAFNLLDSGRSELGWQSRYGYYHRRQIR